MTGTTVARDLRPASWAQLPQPETGFEHIHRYWDPSRARVIAKVSPGEYYITAQDEYIGTVLGSCIATCVRDQRTGLGGMNHFMLPADAGTHDGGPRSVVAASLRYGNFAMEHLLNEFYSRGSRRGDLEIKLFGGGQVMTSSVRVGDKNIAFAREFLSTEGYRIASENVGGYSGRKVLYDPATGRALVKRTHSDEEQKLLRREDEYLKSLEKASVSGSVELF